MALGLLVGTGTGNRISVLLGQRDREGAERVLGQGLRLALINGVVLALVVCAFSKPLLLACGCVPRLLPMAIPFTRIVAVGHIFLIALVSMGNTDRNGAAWTALVRGPITLFGLTGTMAHYFSACTSRARPRCCSSAGSSWPCPCLFCCRVGWASTDLPGRPCADLPFAVVAGAFMVQELAKLRRIPAAT